MKKHFILFLLLFISSFIAAQQIKHVVAAKETLYGLSKKYNTTIDDLRKANPQLNQRTLQIGETLIIPDKNSSSNNISREGGHVYEEGYIYITVKPKETLYGLSRKYNISVDTIKKLNPSLEENGPKIGEVLRIPNNSGHPASTDIESSTRNTIGIQEQGNTQEQGGKNIQPDYTKDGINVIYFLPFHTEKNGSDIERDIASEFYSGAQIALDSLSNRGKKLNVEILDSGNENKFREILNTYDFSNTHLIIGPLFKSSILAVAEKINKIPIVSPFSSNDELDNFENLILYNTKEQILAEKLVDEMLKKYSGEKIYILYDDEHYNTALHFQTLIFNKNGNSEIILTKNARDIQPEQNLVTQEYNKIYTILVSDQDAFIIQYLDNIINLTPNQIQPVSLFYSSLFDNKKYESKLLDFGLIYSDTNYVNEFGFNEQKTINFYKKKYCKIPGKYAVAGFDVTYDILSRMDNKGNLPNNIMKLEGKQLSNKYFFKRLKKNGAWANQGSRIIKLLK